MNTNLTNKDISKYSIALDNKLWTLFTIDLTWDWAKHDIPNQLINSQSLLHALKENDIHHSFIKQILKIKGLYFELYINLPDKILFLGSKGLNYEKELLLSNRELSQLAKNTLESILNNNIYHEYSSLYQQLSKKNREILNNQNVIQKQQFHLNEINQYLKKYAPSLFEVINNKALGLICDHDILRVHLLKFIAALPSIENLPSIIKSSFQETVTNILSANKPLPFHVIQSFKLAHVSSKFIPKKIFAACIKHAVQFVAKKLICSENENKAALVIQGLQSSNRACTLDQLGELVLSQEEADAYAKKIIHIIENSKKLFNTKLAKNPAGIPYQHVSVKTSALTPYFITDIDAFEFVYFHIKDNLLQILMKAMQHQVYINFDAEHYEFRDLTIKLVEKVLTDHEELKYFYNFGFVLQAYLTDSYQHLKLIERLANKRQHRISIRLVKGAYWDQETIQAKAHNHPSPQFLNKIETDLQYRLLMIEILKDYEYLQLCVASHNIEDHCYAEALREELFASAPVIEHQLLHMTYEPLSVAMSNYGWPVRNYLPFGSLLNGMAYLVRRIMENASQTGVLSAVRHHKNLVIAQNILPTFKKKMNEMQEPTLNLPFEPVPLSKLFFPNENDYFNLKQTPEFDKTCENKIYRKVDPLSLFGSINYTSKNEVINFLKNNTQNSSDWQQFEVRAIVIKKAALSLYLNKFEVAKVIVCEAGKTKDEALADVDEAIDFMNYYATEIKNFSDFIPQGNFAIIAPWNFPLAILCGMTTAALLMGNKVVMKPAEQTSLVASMLATYLFEAGTPSSHLLCAFGSGETIGKTLVESNLINGIAFTGSKAVGEYISKKSLEINTQLDNNRKVITELGGKNAIIVCPDAEPDETISGIIFSAFRHAGQKCSACSRVIIHKSVLENFTTRLTNIVQDMIVGSPEFPQTTINPLISEKEKTRALTQAEEMKKFAQENGETILVDRTNDKQFESCVGPLVILTNHKNIQDKAHYFNKELFAPFLYITTWGKIDDAVQIFNQTDYALTGGIFSQSEGYITEFKKRLLCGNLYINRNITGARVAIEPFGGFKLSGTGPKAGGKSYLASFGKPKNLNTTRLKIDQNNAQDLKLNIQKILTENNLDLEALCEKKKWGENELLKIPGQINELNYDISIERLNIHTSSNSISLYTALLLEACQKLSIPVQFFSPAAMNTDALKSLYPDLTTFTENTKITSEAFVFLDCEKEEKMEIMQIYKDLPWVSSIPHILTPEDISHLHCVEVIKRLFCTRAIITNTLRYGAPLQS